MEMGIGEKEDFLAQLDKIRQVVEEADEDTPIAFGYYLSAGEDTTQVVVSGLGKFNLLETIAMATILQRKTMDVLDTQQQAVLAGLSAGAMKN